MFHQCILHGLRKITVKIEEGPKGRNCDVRKLSLEHANKFANGFFSNFLPFVDDAHALTEELLYHLRHWHSPLICLKTRAAAVEVELL